MVGFTAPSALPGGGNQPPTERVTNQPPTERVMKPLDSPLLVHCEVNSKFLDKTPSKHRLLEGLTVRWGISMGWESWVTLWNLQCSGSSLGPGWGNWSYYSLFPLINLWKSLRHPSCKARNALEGVTVLSCPWKHLFHGSLINPWEILSLNT